MKQLRQVTREPTNKRSLTYVIVDCPMCSRRSWLGSHNDVRKDNVPGYGTRWKWEMSALSVQVMPLTIDSIYLIKQRATNAIFMTAAVWCNFL